MFIGKHQCEFRYNSSTADQVFCEDCFLWDVMPCGWVDR